MGLHFCQAPVQGNRFSKVCPGKKLTTGRKKENAPTFHREKGTQVLFMENELHLVLSKMV